jgi:cytochrome c peroxidase
LAEQAQGPFLDALEQNHANSRAVLLKIQAKANNYYSTLWTQAFGTALATTTTALTNTNYDRLGRAVAAYLGSAEVNKFSSKYDKSLVGQATLTAQELAGLELFNTKANCNGCHTMGLNARQEPFTDYGMDNIGVPRNPSPLAPATADGGFGAYLNSIRGYHMWKQFAQQSMGLFKTPTVRNLNRGGNRRYGHNGYFTSLEQIVHFYNTAMVAGAGWNGQPWPPAETPRIADAGGLPVGALGDVGNLGLTPAEEAALVAFLKTLNDDWTPTANRLVSNN